MALLQSETDLVTIRDYLGHASLATTSRCSATNLRMKRDVLQTFWKHVGIELDLAKPWKLKPDLLALLQSLRFPIFILSHFGVISPPRQAFDLGAQDKIGLKILNLIWSSR